MPPTLPRSRRAQPSALVRLAVARFAAVGLVAAGLAGCDGTVADEDAGVRGPSGSRLRFDAAMLERVDAGRGGDAGPPRFDAGPPRFDAGLLDAGPQSCTGETLPCADVPSNGCEMILGCRSGGCEGISRSCYSQFSSYSCIRQDGCVWDSSRNQCGGFAWSCSGYTGRTSCNGQDGCSWDAECEGVERRCPSLSVDECDSQPGCYLR